MNPLDQAAQQTQTPAPTPQDTLVATNAALLKKNQQVKAQAQQSENMAAISAAAAMLHPNAKDPQTQVGKAVNTPAYAGMCLGWVDDQQGKKTGRQATAYADYQANAQQGNINTSQSAPKGARVYFAPDKSNDNDGHVGISNGDGTFTSATDNGIKTFSLPAWMKYTGQKFLGWSK